MVTRTHTQHAVATLWLAAALTAHGVVFHSTNGINHNVSAPTGMLANSGWQYTGELGDFTGTAIASSAVLSARHLKDLNRAPLGTAFIYEHQSFVTTGYVGDAASDFGIWFVDGVFSNVAPLFVGTNELDRDVFIIGRGLERGETVITDGYTNGWRWGEEPNPRTRRWGLNHIESFRDFATYGDQVFMVCTFDLSDGPDEAMLSSGDSGGPAFVREGEEWQLAGVNGYVDPARFSTNSTGADAFYGTLYDYSRLYYHNGASWVYAPPIDDPRPCTFLSTRVSRRLAWIWQQLPELAPPPSPTLILVY